MPEPISTVSTLYLSVASGLAAKATEQLLKEAYKQATEMLDPTTWNTKIKKTLVLSLEDAAPAQLDDGVLREFTSDPQNAQILSGWVLNPSQAGLTQEHLDVESYATSYVHRANLRRLLDGLPEAIVQARDRVFDEEAKLVITEVSEAVRSEGQRTRDHVDEKFSKQNDQLSEQGEGINRMEAMMKKVLENSQRTSAPVRDTDTGSGISDQVEDWINDQLDESRTLAEAGQLKDALSLALDALEKIEQGNLSDAARIVAHQRVANAHLASVEGGKLKAIPHLQAIAELSDDTQVQLRNRALANSLNGDTEAAIRLVNEALERDSEDAGALRLKADFLGRSGRENEAADLYEEIADPENPDDLFNLSWALCRVGRFEEAREVARDLTSRNPEDPKGHEILSLVISLYWHEAIVTGSDALDEGAAKRLHEAEDHAGTAIDLYEERQEPRRLSQVYLTQGIIRIWQERYKEGQQDLRRAHELVPEQEIVLQNLAFGSFLLEEYSTGLEYVDEMKRIGVKIPKAQMLEIEVRLLLGAGRSGEALRLLDSVLPASGEDSKANTEGRGAHYRSASFSSAEQLTVQLLRVRALEKSYRPSEAKQLLRQLKEEHTDTLMRVRVLIDEAQYHERENNLDAAITNLREVLSSAATGKESSRALYLLAELLYKRGATGHAAEFARERSGLGLNSEAPSSEDDFEEALGIYEGLSTSQIDDHAFRQRVLCLFYLGRRAECLELCAPMQSEGRIPFYTEVEARIYFGLSSFKEAGVRFEHLADVTNNVHFQLRYAHCLFRLGKEEQARGVAEIAARDIRQDEPLRHLQASQFFAAAGEMKRAVHHAYVALNEGWDEALFHQAYISLFVNYGRQIEEQNAASEEHRKATRDAFARYDDRFPNDTFFRCVEMPLDDPEEMMRRIREQWPSEEEMVAFEKMLEENDLPVGSLARARGQTIPQAWRLLVSNPKWGLAADEHPLRFLANEVKVAHRLETIVADLPVLLTLDEIGLLDKTLEAFERVLVPQPVLDELQAELERARAQEGEDRGSIHPVGDEEIIYVETPAEVADRWVRKIERLKSVVASERAEVIGATANRFEGFYTASDGGDTNELREAVGACSTEAFLEARVREVPIYAESWMIRSLARAEDVEAFGTRAVIGALEQKEVISPRASREASVELLKLNFYFPLISTALMAHQVESCNYLINDESTFVLKVLLSPHFETWLIRVFFGCRFLLWLWSQYQWPAVIDGGRSLIASWTHELYDVLSEAEAPCDLPRFAFVTVREKLKGGDSTTIISQFEKTYSYWRESAPSQRSGFSNE